MIPILTTSSTVMCPHGGQALLITNDTEVVIDGAPALLESDMHPVIGCPFAPGGVYTPCVTIRWTAGALKAKLRGVPLLLRTSIGVCNNAAQAPQGVAMVVQTQQRALVV
jgi:hypothetical protein